MRRIQITNRTLVAETIDMFETVAAAEAEYSERPVAGVRLDCGFELQIEYFSDLAVIQAELRALRDGPFLTLFNSQAWLSSWLSHARTNETPCLLLARDQDAKPAFLWPMAIHRKMGVNILGWLGQSTFAVNTGCYRADVAAKLTRNDLLTIFNAVRRKLCSFDAVHMRNQPDTVSGYQNPMLALESQCAANGNHERALASDYDALYQSIFTSRERRNHARQRRRLVEFGEIDISIATDPGEKSEVLETFFAFKAAQLETIGASNPFSDDRLRDFYRAALSKAETEQSSPVYCGLRINGELVATLIGVYENTPLHHVDERYHHGGTGESVTGATAARISRSEIVRTRH